MTTEPPLPARSRNFGFLAYHDPRLSAFGAQAERLFALDPSACLGKLRLFGEVLAQGAAARLGLLGPVNEAQADLVARLSRRGALSDTTQRLFDGLRTAGNRAVHEGAGEAREALHQLQMAQVLAVWFQRAFGNNKKFDPGPFVPPPDPVEEDAALREALVGLRAELAASKVDAEAARAAAEAEARARLSQEQLAARLEEERQVWETLAHDEAALRTDEVRAVEARLRAELAALQAKVAALAPAAIQAAVDGSAQAAQAIALSEADTRRIVDQQLREAGWEADTRALTHGAGARPQKGRNLAIAEWPTKTGPVDYALFIGLDLVAVVEAKKMGVDVSGVLVQAARYSRGLRLDGQAKLVGGPWGDGHEVPFLFATNGRPYLKQLETKSGIWFRDTRRPQNLARALAGWYTPEGLAALLGRDVDAAHEKLRTEPTGYLDLRPYQIRAVEAVEGAITEGRRACLVAMATGTGKTRTAICLVYRLLKARRFRRVLFLVDRGALGEQTENALHDLRIENLQTFAQIYDVKGLDAIRPDPATKLHVATIQGMVKRVLGASSPGERPSVDQYDCIVVDECHRGYTLDQELGEVELRFRDLADYVSKYRRVLDHFDAVKIGLTATPAQHTCEIFGKPVFTYAYREAVLDGCLVDHEPPVEIKTALAEDGIVWQKGDRMRLWDRRARAERLVDAPDEVKIEVEGFNRQVITESFNRVVSAELAKYIDPALPAKTIVFCVDDEHADLVVKLLKEAFQAQYGEVEDAAVQKITGAVDRPLDRIRHFKNERLPSVAVTVDLLSTGVDVPRVSNIVFLRRVQSRILYDQMMGRATRLCPEIDKTTFHIFDAVGLYDALEDMTSMTPIVADVKITFLELVRELGTAPDDEARALVLEQLVGKLQRRRQALKGAALTRFESIAGMPIAEVARTLRASTPEAAAAWFAAHQYVIPFLDSPTDTDRPVLVSDHRDHVRYVARGYGKGNQRPADYLDGFRAYLRDNLNTLPALVVVTQRPRDLTRAALRDLKLALDGAGYGEVALRSAYATETNAEIAASVMGFIRRAALGDPLVPYAQRVDRALAKILGTRAWQPIQRTWLERIAKQIKADEVVDRASVEGGQFKADGGFARLDKVFDGRLLEVLGDLREAIWENAS